MEIRGFLIDKMKYIVTAYQTAFDNRFSLV